MSHPGEYKHSNKQLSKYNYGKVNGMPLAHAGVGHSWACAVATQHKKEDCMVSIIT